MKRLILTTLLLSTFFISKAQDPTFWPNEVKHIPGLDVEVFGIDKAHSKLSFAIGFFGFSDVEGTFGQYSGTILYNEKDLTKTAISLIIDANSINTGSSFRDKDLKTGNFFDTENHRFLTFESKSIEKKGKKMFAIGDLTIKGKTKEVRVPFEQTQKRFIDPFWSNLVIGFKGEITIDRNDFDVHGGRWGEKVLSEEVKISFAMVAQQPNTFKWGSGEISASMNEVVNAYVKNGADDGKAKFEEVTSGIEMNSFIEGLTAKRLIQKYHFKEAIAFLEMAIEKFPKNAGLYKDKAKAHAFLGEKNKAVEIYEQIIARNANDTEAKMILKRLK